MPPKKDTRNRQPTVELESSGGENGGETGGELVPTTSHSAVDRSMIPGIPQPQLETLMSLFGGMLDQRMQRFEQRLERMEERFGLPPHQNSTPLPSTEIPEASLTKDLPSYTIPRQLRAEEVGYFDPEYQQEQGIPNGPVVNAGKHVFYKDVYVFTDRLKDLAVQRGDEVKRVITSCFRGSALMWYSIELTELERDLLRDANLDLWYTTLINRFKTRTSVALSQMVGQMYGLADIRHTSPRAFIQQMLHLAKSAQMNSVYNQLTIIWNQFAVSLRQHIPEPQPRTTIGQFLEQVDSKTAIWMEMAQRQQHRPWQNGPPLQDSTQNRHANEQRGTPPQQHGPPARGGRFPPRVPINEGRHAYLADVTPDGYGVYEEEDEANLESHGQR